MVLAHILRLEVLGFLYALAATIAFKMLTGRINVTGLLSQIGTTRNVSPGRIQLLLATIAASASYLSQVASSTDGKLPGIDAKWLYLFGGSGSIYAFEKVWVTWIGKKNT